MQYNHFLHWFPCTANPRVTCRIFNVLVLIIRMSPICPQSEQGLGVCGLYLPKIDVNESNVIQSKTGMYRIKCRDPPLALNLLSHHFLPFLINGFPSPPLHVSLSRFIYKLFICASTYNASHPQVQFFFIPR